MFHANVETTQQLSSKFGKKMIVQTGDAILAW